MPDLAGPKDWEIQPYLGLMPIVLAKKHGLKLSQISGTIFPYPTMVEGVKRASDAYQRARLEGTGGRVLKKVISWLK